MLHLSEEDWNILYIFWYCTLRICIQPLWFSIFMSSVFLWNKRFSYYWHLELSFLSLAVIIRKLLKIPGVAKEEKRKLKHLLTCGAMVTIWL